MRYPPSTPTYQCAPKEFRNVPDITGSFELDRVIWRNPNKNMANRISFYAGDPRVSGFKSYGPRTGYNGYDGLTGDE